MGHDDYPYDIGEGARSLAVGRLRQWARRLRRDSVALYLAARHPDTPWYAKLAAGAVAAYALSPIDLIPDFIPVLGYLDDLLIVPVGIALCVRMVPKSVMDECREQAEKSEKPPSVAAAVFILVVWIIFGAWAISTLWGLFAD
ncbi:MAG: YkvA family protein [Anaerosomatales bacterium]|nr:YkvA family protein [Anaerosomatales bacterium]